MQHSPKQRFGQEEVDFAHVLELPFAQVDHVNNRHRLNHVYWNLPFKLCQLCGHCADLVKLELECLFNSISMRILVIWF
jgi:hypothetical protein